MDLWIRNQDRCVLQKVKKIYVTTYSEEAGFGLYDINYDDLDDCDVSLGFYKTRERALEVLDEIQEIIESHIGKKASGMGYEFFSSAVYEMPKE